VNSDFILDAISFKLSRFLLYDVSVICDNIRTLNFIANSLQKRGTDAVFTFRKRSDQVYLIDASSGPRGVYDLTLTFSYDELMKYVIIKRLDKLKKIID